MRTIIGIEWEPQLTFLSYPNMAVYVFEDDDLSLATVEWEHEKIVRLGVPRFPKRSELDMYVDTGVLNLEIYTQPVQLKDLQEEIDRHTKILGEFIEKISYALEERIGVFLPKPRPAKHVNLSFHENKNPFKTRVEIKPSWETSQDSDRIHITVPYNFIDYENLSILALNYQIIATKKGYFHASELESFLQINLFNNLPKMVEPIFVGYTNRAFKWVKIKGLV